MKHPLSYKTQKSKKNEYNGVIFSNFCMLLSFKFIPLHIYTTYII